jgi:hypothetical protein
MIPMFEWAKTIYALDRTATVIRAVSFVPLKTERFSFFLSMVYERDVSS